MSKMGAAVGIGAANVTVELSGTEFAWGDSIRGTVRLTGGNVEQTASEIRVAVQEHWETRDSDGDRQDSYKTYNEQVIAQGVTVQPGATTEFSFEVALPEGATPAHKWSVIARMCVAKAADRRGEQAFSVTMPAAFHGLRAALTEIAAFTQHSTVVKGAQAEFDFRPPAELKSRLDGVKLIMNRQDGNVTGTLEINPQERSVGDFLKALARKDRVHHPISFPEAPLSAAPNGPAPAEVVARLRELLQPYLG